MGTRPAPAGAARADLSPSGGIGRWFGLLGCVIVGYYLVLRILDGLNPAVAVIACVVVVLWVTSELLPPRLHLRGIVVSAALILLGCAVAAATDGLAIAPAIVGVLRMVRDPGRPIGVAIGLGVVGAAIVPVGSLGTSISPVGIAALVGGLLLAFLGGLSRRQFLMATIQSRELLEQSMTVREEQSRIATLAARQAIAREIHDVLAHSLGGLVIQLDAVDALLDASRVGTIKVDAAQGDAVQGDLVQGDLVQGDAVQIDPVRIDPVRLEEAAVRIRAARSMAAEGLGEARRAVEALRDEPATARDRVHRDEFVAGLTSLIDSHRVLGGAAKMDETGPRRDLPADVAAAVHRALQEALTNARRHAQGQAVTAHLVWTGSDVSLDISNPLGSNPLRANPLGAVGESEPGTPGGGFGLNGMRERFAALPNGFVSAGRDGDQFVVHVRAGTL